MRAIDADALQLAIVEEGQANKRKKYIIGDIWELTGAEIREVINSQPTIQPDNNSENPNGSDAISRQEAIDKFEPWLKVNEYSEGEFNMLRAVLYELRFLPPAQPERKKGTWVFVRGEEAGNALYECSACGKGDIHAPEVRVSYCWNCGAQMGEEA